MPAKGPSRNTVVNAPFPNPCKPSNLYTFLSPSIGPEYSLNPITSTRVLTTCIGLVIKEEIILEKNAEKKSIICSFYFYNLG